MLDQNEPVPDYLAMLEDEDTDLVPDYAAMLEDDYPKRFPSNNLEAAEELAANGFAVFPLNDWKGNGNRTGPRGWPDLASCDLSQVRSWLAKWPDAGVGLPCGKVNGIVCMDVDVKNGKDGLETLRRLGFPDPEGMSPVCVRTPSGGLHIFFGYDSRLRNSVSKVGIGLDIRTDRGFVVAPGSFKGDKQYGYLGARLGTVELPPFPEALIPPQAPERTAPAVIANPTPAQISWAQDKLQRLADDLAATCEGGRNDALNAAAMWAGGAAAHGFLDEREAQEALKIAAETAGLDKSEIRNTMRSGWRAGLRKPLTDFPREFEFDEDEFDDLPVLGEEDDGDDAVSTEFDTSEELRSQLSKMNKGCALVIVGGKSMIAVALKCAQPSFWQVRAFHDYFANRRVEIIDQQTKKPKSVPLSVLWMNWKQRNTKPGGIGFYPEGADDQVYNLWRGWNVKPAAMGTCSRLLDHLSNVICDRDDAMSAYLLGWLAHLVQHPADKPGVAIVLRGLKGTGKDILGRYLARMIGPRHVSNIAQQDHLLGKFNEHLQSALLLHVEEAIWAGSRQGESVLKNIITAPTLTIERKGVDAYQARSCFRVLMSSNEAWTVPASPDERRFAVFDVSDRRRGDAEYFSKLHAEMNGGGPAALLHFLQNYDLSGFNVRQPPDSQGLLGQKIASLRGVEAWWFDVLNSAALPSAFGDQTAWEHEPQAVDRHVLRTSYMDWRRTRPFDGPAASEATFGRKLRDLVPEIEDRRPRIGGARIWHYQFPTLARCRALFDSWIGSPLHWDQPD